MNIKDTKAYSSISGSAMNEAVGGVVDAITNNKILKTAANAKNIINDTVSSVSFATKLILSETGIARQLLHGKAGSDDEDVKKADKQELFSKSNTLKVVGKDARSAEIVGRYEYKNDFFFKIGDYFLPLTVTYSVEGNKEFAESQLIDSINIIERVAIRPQTIDVSIRFERRKGTQGEDNLHIEKDNGTLLPTVLDNISAMFNDLWRKKDVFQISNKFINEEIGVKYVVLRSYNVQPIQGSTLFEVHLNLYEINMTENIIFDENASIDNGFNIR